MFRVLPQLIHTTSITPCCRLTASIVRRGVSTLPTTKDKEVKKEKVLLTATPGRYKGLTVNEESIPESEARFGESLSHSVETWRMQGYRGVWIKIEKSKSHLIPQCLKNGFEFHHTGKDYVMLTTWLPIGETSRLPQYADHSIGCGGAVINDKNEILLVTEAHTPDTWKIPGGMLNTGEEIPDAAIREVFEETGIKATFESLLGFRHTHESLFTSGNVYSICLLRATTQDIIIDPNEIALCRWAPLEEFYNMKNVPPVQQAVAQLIKNYLNSKGSITGWKYSDIHNTIKNIDSKLYHGGHNLDFSHLTNANQTKQ